MSFVYKKLIAHNQKQNVAVSADFTAAGRSVTAAEKFLKKWPNFNAERINQCSLKELKVWRDTMRTKASFNYFIPIIDKLISEKEHESAQASTQSSKKTQANKKFQTFNELTSGDLIAEAEELQESEVVLLLEWERSNKNRASVIKALSLLLSENNSPIESTPHASKKSHGPNPFKAENEKIYKKGRGTVREMCQECGETNAIDVALLSEVIHRRSNSTRGRMNDWADRQIEGGSRMSGRHAAAEASRANQMNLANQVSSGFPCTFCGAPLLR